MLAIKGALEQGISNEEIALSKNETKSYGNDLYQMGGAFRVTIKEYISRGRDF